MERPRGVALLVVLIFLNALNMLLAGILLLAGFLDLRAISFLFQIAALVMHLFGMIAGCGSHALSVLTLMLQVPPNLFFIAEFLIAVLYAAIGFGLLKLQNWARWLVIALCILEVILAVVGYTVPRFLLFRLSILGMLIDVAAVIFLFQSTVKEVFEAGAN